MQYSTGSVVRVKRKSENHCSALSGTEIYRMSA